MAGTPHATRLPDTRAADRREGTWRARLDRLTPAALRSHDDEFDRTCRERTKRMWIGDGIATVFILLVAVAVYASGHNDGRHPAELMTILNGIFVPVSIVLIFWRRQYPFQISVALSVISCVAPATATAAMIGVFAVAAYSRPAVGVLGIVFGLFAAPIAPAVWPHASGDASFWTDATFGAIITLGFGAWGLFAGARRELLASLRERAVRAESEQQMRVDQARQAERTRIAREMHDVLAHRMSLLSVHAGALEF
ncbi:MAG: histidine kinase dimerization/phosphoacceptor domain-containing protein, partial [Solirubrobacteraceae bacterium]